MNFLVGVFGFLGIAADLYLILGFCCGLRVVSVCDFVGLIRGSGLRVVVSCKFAVLVIACASGFLFLVYSFWFGVVGLVQIWLCLVFVNLRLCGL